MRNFIITLSATAWLVLTAILMSGGLLAARAGHANDFPRDRCSITFAPEPPD